MAEYQLGNNLYGNDTGQYYSYEHGPYSLQGKQYNGLYKKYTSSPLDASTTYLNNLYGAQQKSQLGALKAQQQKATTGFNQQKKDLVPQYQGQRNAADVTNAQNVQKLRELMASNGINASGENVTASANLGAQRQAALSDINTQQNQANSAIDKQIADVNDPYHAQSIIDQMTSDRSKALLDARNQAQSQMMQQYQQYMQDQWNKYQFNNLSKDQLEQLKMNQYQINAGNEANSAASQAELNYYKNLGFNPAAGGGGTATGAKGTDAFNKNLAAANAQGVDKSWNDAITWIVGKESGYDPNAANKTSTARGYAQFLKDTRREYEKKLGLDYNNPVDQLVMMKEYLKDRYKTPQGAIAFWQKNHWY